MSDKAATDGEEDSPNKGLTDACVRTAAEPKNFVAVAAVATSPTARIKHFGVYAWENTTPLLNFVNSLIWLHFKKGSYLRFEHLYASKNAAPNPNYFMFPSSQILSLSEYKTQSNRIHFLGQLPFDVKTVKTFKRANKSCSVHYNSS